MKSTIQLNEISKEKVRNLLDLLPKEPSVFPTSNNTIQMEYEEKNKYLEIEVYESGVLDVYEEIKNKSHHYNNVTLEFIIEKVENF